MRTRAIELCDCGQVAKERAAIAPVVHQAREKREAWHQGAMLPAIEIAIRPEGGAMRDHHAHAMVERATQQQRVAERLAIPDGNRPLHPGVRDERHVEFAERGVETVAERRRGIHPHRGVHPLTRQRAVPVREPQCLDAVGAVGTNSHPAMPPPLPRARRGAGEVRRGRD